MRGELHALTPLSLRVSTDLAHGAVRPDSSEARDERGLILFFSLSRVEEDRYWVHTLCPKRVAQFLLTPSVEGAIVLRKRKPRFCE